MHVPDSKLVNKEKGISNVRINVAPRPSPKDEPNPVAAYYPTPFSTQRPFLHPDRQPQPILLERYVCRTTPQVSGLKVQGFFQPPSF